MTVQYYQPSKLRGIVDIIWEQQSDMVSRWKILPSGKVELIFGIGPKAEIIASKKLKREDSPLDHFCFLSGLHTKPIVMNFQSFHYIGVQMKPIAVKALFQMPLCEIRDYWAEGASLFSNLQEIEDNLNKNTPFLKKAQWLEKFLFEKIYENADLRIALNLQQATSHFIERKHNCQQKSIESLLGYSRTQTFRIFNEWFGISAHSYQKLIQFVKSVHSLHHNDDNLTYTGLNNGYFDQSHFIRSFKEFSEMTPGEYKKQMTMLPGQLPG